MILFRNFEIILRCVGIAVKPENCPVTNVDYSKNFLRRKIIKKKNTEL